MASVVDIRTYVYGATYDSWNRVQTMTYPDGEVVTYHCNAAGQVESMTSIHHLKTYRISSMANSSMKKQACTITVQGT